MNLATGLLALVLMGSDGSGGPVDNGLRYDVRILDMPGVAWRGDLHEALNPIAHQGRVCVWTMSRDFSAKLTQRAVSQFETPRVTGQENTSASVRVGRSTPFVSHLTRVADGPVGHAHAIALKPTIERAENSLKIQIQGRRIDQGVLAQVEILDTRIDRMLSYHYSEKMQGLNGPVTLDARAEVPEVSSSTAQGEWMIPLDGVLIVSLGLHTRTDDAGKAETMERLALIDVQTVTQAPVAVRGLPEGLPPLPIAASTLFPQNSETQPLKVHPVTLKPIEPILPTATLPPPSRALPTAINHKGQIVETEVPDDEPMTDSDDSGETRPTPQHRVPAVHHDMPYPSPPSIHNAARENHPNHTEPFLNRYYRELMTAGTTPNASRFLRIEPRINVEIHLTIPELSIGNLPEAANVLSSVTDLSALAPWMERAASSYLASSEKNPGAFPIFDMAFPIGKSIKSRFTVLISCEEGSSIKKDESTTPVRFERSQPPCPASGCDQNRPDDAACPPPCVDDPTSSSFHSNGPESTSPHRLTALEAGSMASPTVLGLGSKPTLETSRNRIQVRLLAIEEQFEHNFWNVASIEAGDYGLVFGPVWNGCLISGTPATIRIPLGPLVALGLPVSP